MHETMQPETCRCAASGGVAESTLPPASPLAEGCVDQFVSHLLAGCSLVRPGTLGPPGPSTLMPLRHAKKTAWKPRTHNSARARAPSRGA